MNDRQNEQLSSGIDERLISSLGLCARARALIIGAPSVIEAVRKGGKNAPRLVLEASDTSENTHKRICDKCAYYNVKHKRLDISSATLSEALGKSSSVAAVAITDDNFYKLILKYTEN